MLPYFGVRYSVEGESWNLTQDYCECEIYTFMLISSFLLGSRNEQHVLKVVGVAYNWEWVSLIVNKVDVDPMKREIVLLWKKKCNKVTIKEGDRKMWNKIINAIWIKEKNNAVHLL